MTTAHRAESTDDVPPSAKGRDPGRICSAQKSPQQAKREAPRSWSPCDRPLAFCATKLDAVSSGGVDRMLTQTHRAVVPGPLAVSQHHPPVRTHKSGGHRYGEGVTKHVFLSHIHEEETLWATTT